MLLPGSVPALDVVTILAHALSNDEHASITQELIDAARRDGRDHKNRLGDLIHKNADVITRAEAALQRLAPPSPSGRVQADGVAQLSPSARAAIGRAAAADVTRVARQAAMSPARLPIECRDCGEQGHTNRECPCNLDREAEKRAAGGRGGSARARGLQGAGRGAGRVPGLAAGGAAGGRGAVRAPVVPLRPATLPPLPAAVALAKASAERERQRNDLFNTIRKELQSSKDNAKGPQDPDHAAKEARDQSRHDLEIRRAAQVAASADDARRVLLTASTTAAADAQAARELRAEDSKHRRALELRQQEQGELREREQHENARSMRQLQATSTAMMQGVLGVMNRIMS